MKDKLKKLVALSLTLLMVASLIPPVSVEALSNEQLQRADTIASICIANWNTYGVLPSVAVGQAMQESTLGKYNSGSYNLWGIGPGRNYSSLSNGTIGYLKVINNGYYKGAKFKTSPSEQMAKIAHNYCPEPGYYNAVMSCINQFGFKRYDTKLFKALKQKSLKEKKRKAAIRRKQDAKLVKEFNKKFKKQLIKQRNLTTNTLLQIQEHEIKDTRTYEVKYQQNVSENAVIINTSYDGSVLLYEENDCIGIYDVLYGVKDGVYTSNKELVGKQVTLVFRPDAKG